MIFAFSLLIELQVGRRRRSGPFDHFVGAARAPAIFG